MKWEKVKLGDVCDVMMGQSPPGDQYNSEKLGKPLITGSGQLGELYPKPTQWSKTGQRSSIKDDLILSIRASIGDLNLSDRDYFLGRGVAGLRPSEKLDSRYLWFAIGITSDELASKGTGSTFLQVRRADVENIEIPLPPLAEQKRLAAILDRADELRRARRKVLLVLDELAQSLFLELFGDPAANPKGWDVVRLGEIGEMDRGKSKHRPRNAPHLYGNEYPFIQTGDVANCGGYIREVSQFYSEAGLKQSKIWPAGTLCITIAANIAKTGMLTFDACFPDSVVGFKPTKCEVEYVKNWFGFVQSHLEEIAPESAQKNINLKILREFPIPLPPLPLQQKFAAQIAELETIKSRARASLNELDALFASLQVKAFAGELSDAA